MAELYDEGVLHSILGVKPLPTIVKHVQTDEKIRHKPNSSSKRQAVEDTWEQNRDYDEYSQSRHHHRVADEDGGRYDIGRQSPRKRRRTGRARDHNDHPVVFVDDDDEEERRMYADDPEGGEYDSDEGDFDRYPSYSEKSRNDRRTRSYWLSKGIGPGSVDDDD